VADDERVTPAATGDNKVPPGTRCNFCHAKAVMRLRRHRRTLGELALRKQPDELYAYACGGHLGRALDHLRRRGVR